LFLAAAGVLWCVFLGAQASSSAALCVACMGDLAVWALLERLSKTSRNDAMPESYLCFSVKNPPTAVGKYKYLMSAIDFKMAFNETSADDKLTI
jgi:hypothetical protein